MYSIERFQLDLLGEPRTIRVYLPKDIANPNRRFPVLYMHDGHNLFDKESSYAGNIWDVHNTLENIFDETNKNCIVVGIDCHPTKRLTEYSPWVTTSQEVKKQFPSTEPIGGGGKKYIDWLVFSLKPYIDSNYPTIPIATYLAGSSMGGLISLYAGYRYPKVFKKIGCFSSAFWFARPKIISYLRKHHDPSVGVYLDVGTCESSLNIERLSKVYVNDTIRIKTIIEEMGTRDIKLVIDGGGIHSEIAWKKRFPLFAKWLLTE